MSPFFGAPVARDAAPELNAAQGGAVDALVAALGEGAPRSFLLHGVTGSGKTEVYLHAIDACLRGGRGALVLVPEIALTPQLGARFRGRFGDRVAILHSGLTDAARADAYHRIRRGEIAIALGASMGDRRAALELAAAALRHLGPLVPSRIIATPPFAAKAAEADVPP